MVHKKNLETYREEIIQQLAKSQNELIMALIQSYKQELIDSVEEIIEEKINTRINSMLQNNYTRKEAAKKIGISLVTLDKYINEGVIKASRLGKSVRIEASEIKNCLKAIKSRNHKY